MEGGRGRERTGGGKGKELGVVGEGGGERREGVQNLWPLRRKESFGKALMHLLWHRVYRHGIREEADGKHSDGR